MARPRKCRKVCRMPIVSEFSPNGQEDINPVILTIDEYETIRLIDYQDFSQEECSRYMDVARTTIQLVYNNARKKIAKALVEGLSIRIEGGDYTLCDKKESSCTCGGCELHRKRLNMGDNYE